MSELLRGTCPCQPMLLIQYIEVHTAKDGLFVPVPVLSVSDVDARVPPSTYRASYIRSGFLSATRHTAGWLPQNGVKIRK